MRIYICICRTCKCNQKFQNAIWTWRNSWTKCAGRELDRATDQAQVDTVSEHYVDTFSLVMSVSESSRFWDSTIVKTACDLLLVSFMLVAATVLQTTQHCVTQTTESTLCLIATNASSVTLAVCTNFFVIFRPNKLYFNTSPSVESKCFLQAPTQTRLESQGIIIADNPRDAFANVTGVRTTRLVICRQNLPNSICTSTF